MTETSRRTLEIWTAAAIALFGGIVSAESLTHDIGWNDNGPGPGYFPFRVGLLLIGAAAVLLVQQRRTTTSPVFVTGEELARSLNVFLPTVALVASMFVLGLYVPSAVYLAWMMHRHGGYGWLRAAAAAIAAMMTFFLIFDVWFRVPLAKGPVEAMFGIY
jgi:hypothetical protein